MPREQFLETAPADCPIDTSFKEEVGKFQLGGGVTDPAPRSNPSGTGGGKAQAEEWADRTHFGFPDIDLDDEIVDALAAAEPAA